MKLQVILVLVSVLIVGGCSSNDDDTSSTTGSQSASSQGSGTTVSGTTAGDLPVSGEFHAIQPVDVDTYVTSFQTQRSRVALLLDGVQHELSFIDLDIESKSLIAGYGTNLVQIGFDIENEESLQSVVIVEIKDGVVARQFSNNSLSLQETPTEDIVYSGTLRDEATDRELEIMLTINEALITGGNSALTVSGTDAFLNGELGTQTYVQMRDMIAANPAVTRLVIQKSSGSVNDDINMHTGRLIRGATLATHVPADGDINSGAVDLFVAGVTRTVENGGVLGVHSWCCENGVAADELSKDDAAHGPQLTYFREMLGDAGEEAYFFTLEAAPSDDIHQLLRQEMIDLKITTQ